MKLNHVKCYIKDYPRPQFVRRDWLNLSGEWDFVFDDANEGESKKFYEQFPKETRKITVPFSYLCKNSGIGDTARHDFLWYSRSLNIDAEKLSGCVNLIFEGSDYTTKVWANGVLAGVHNGGCGRFSFDITKLLKCGENTLVVKTEDDFRTDKPRGKQRWKNDNFGCWYEETSGIYKTVWLDFTAAKAIKDVQIVPHYDEHLVEFVFSAPKGYTVCAEVERDGCKESCGCAEVNSAYTKLVLPIDAECEHWGMKPWTAGLYDVTFMLKDTDGNILDTVGSYFGFRKFEIIGDRLYFNDRPLYLKMLLDQGYWRDSHLTPPDEDAIVKDVILTKEAGFNGIRKHQKLEDERFYYYCDILGVFVWAEMPSAYAFNENTVETVSAEWTSEVKQLRNHPSVMAWVPFNESWGVGGIHCDKTQQAFTESMYYLTKTLDGEKRPVISNDGWEHTKSDIITIHNYAQYGERIIAEYKDKERALGSEVVNEWSGRSALAEGYKYEGQPVIISEFGGIAYSKDKKNGCWGYGDGVLDEKAYLERLKSLMDAIKALPYVCGYCLTQTTDVMQEVNGIVDMERTPKAALTEIKKINEA